MLNQIVLVGRIANEIQEITNEQLVITLAVPRSFKNMNGEYDTDFIPVKLYKSMAENTAAYCRKGDIVGVKGRMQSEEINGFNMLNIIAEKVTFLSSSKEKEGE